MADMEGKFILCPIGKRSEWADELSLPPDDTNIFSRIIRNPHAESDNPKERECSEMVVALLKNCPSLRQSIFSWMGRLVKCHAKPWESESCSISIDTELSVGGKRDDIRIVLESDTGTELLWTIEVKVGASFHVSSSLEKDELPSDLPEDEDDINQLLNYDSSLLVPESKRYPKATIAGFVLAKHDMTKQLPTGLKCPWICLTWTELGMVIAEFLKGKDLPEKEAFLGRHTLGFIKQELWEEEKMTDTNLDLDDVSLIKAFGLMGVECENKVNALVAPLGKVLAEVIEGIDKPYSNETLFKKTRRSVWYAKITKRAKSSYVCCGIEASSGDTQAVASLWIETASGHAMKAKVRSAVKSKIGDLQKLNEHWKIGEDDQYNKDIILALPLKYMIVEKDQGKWLIDFVVKAINDFKAVGLLDELRSFAE